MCKKFRHYARQETLKIYVSQKKIHGSKTLARHMNIPQLELHLDSAIANSCRKNEKVRTGSTTYCT
jgi:hypothetical protein